MLKIALLYIIIKCHEHQNSVNEMELLEKFKLEIPFHAHQDQKASQQKEMDSYYQSMHGGI